MKERILVTLSILSWLAGPAVSQESMLLNGQWEMGECRHYSQTVEVPGIHCDPTQMNNDTLWYRREVILPKGAWTYATLELKGARFAPAVFVDGQQVSRADGGMAPTFHLLNSQTVKPGKTITLEVALTSLKDLPKTDASYIAVSDHWCSNVSSSLWDDVVLHLHGADRMVNVIPEADTRQYWWSIFENLGVYYDNYQQFDQAVMADEFGGNYLDKNGDYGGYPSVKESFLRFCGRHNTKEQRLRQQTLSTGKIAEYWRRTDVAGWTPYTIISSYEDGNNWFLGDMREGRPMPVWQSMAAGWSPQAVSLDTWDVNYTPGQNIRVPVCYFNDPKSRI